MSATTNDPITYAWVSTSWAAVTKAMHHLAYPTHDASKPHTWTVETEVVAATFRAYDAKLANGWLRNGVPTRKTNKQREIDVAVYHTLLPIAQLAMHATETKAEEWLHEAWLAAQEQS